MYAIRSYYDGSERVRILLKMLSDHFIPVELSVGQIEKQKKKSVN